MNSVLIEIHNVRKIICLEHVVNINFPRRQYGPSERLGIVLSLNATCYNIILLIRKIIIIIIIIKKRLAVQGWESVIYTIAISRNTAAPEYQPIDTKKRREK